MTSPRKQNVLQDVTQIATSEKLNRWNRKLMQGSQNGSAAPGSASNINHLSS
jgi:hypothetical protein